MLKFLSKKNNGSSKKIVIWALLFFILSGVFLPNTSLALIMAPAGAFGCSATITSLIGGSLQLVWDGTKWINPVYWTYRAGKWVKEEISESSSPPVEPESSNIENCSAYITSYIIAWLGYGIASLGEYIAYGFASVFDFTVSKLVLDDSGKWAITNESNPNNFLAPTFVLLWGTVKEWANMLIALGFIGVALAFILNLDQYKKLLGPLLIIALLINFSNVLVGLVIDASNIVMTSLISGGNLTGGNVGYNLIYKINGSWNHSLRFLLIDNTRTAFIYLSLSVFFCLIYLTTAFSLFLFSLLFIIRYVLLAILFIFSSLALVLRIIPFPAAQKLWGDWWQGLIKWSFIGLSGAFFLRLATDVMVGLERFFVKAPIGSAQITPVVIVGSISEIFFYILIVQMFLYAGIWFTFKSNPLVKVLLGVVAAIAAAIITGGTSLMGGALKMSGKATGRSGTLTNAKNTVGDIGSKLYHGAREGLGLMPVGSSSAYETERRKARIDKNVESAAENATLAQLEKGARTGSMANRAIYQKKLAEKGEFSRVVDAQRKGESNVDYEDRKDNGQKTAMENMIGHGMSVKEVIEKDPRLAQYDIAARSDLKAKNPKWSDAEISDALISKAYQKSTVSNIREMSKDAIGDIEFLKNTNVKRLREAAKDLSSDRRAVLKSKLGPGGELEKAYISYKADAKFFKTKGDFDNVKIYEDKAKELKNIYTEIKGM